MVHTPPNAPAASTAVEAPERRVERRRVYLSSFIGSTIEYYDFFIYATAASLVFGELFFAGVSPTIGVIASFATLAVGYLARPLGGIVFAHYGDRVGRKKILVLTLVLMSASTTLIGLLPTSAQVGALAPVLLVVLRVVQGFAVGGEWGGAVLMTAEHARTGRRGVMGSATQAGAGAGLLLSFGAFGAASAIAGDSFTVWGWRLPFVISILLFVLALYIRLKISESPLHQEALRAQDASGGPTRIPLLEVLRTHPKELALAVGTDMGPFMAQAVMATFVISYGSTQFGIPRGTLINAMIIASAVMLVAMPAFAALTDRIGRRPVFFVASALWAVLALFMFPLVGTGSFVVILLTFIAGIGILNSATQGIIGVVLPELFPTHIRYTGVSLAHQLAGVIGGGLGPLAAAALASSSLGVTGAAVFIAVACIISALCVLRLREGRSVDLREV